MLPLPSENWREMSSDWCCHGNEYTKSLAQSSLMPKEWDCFLSELYLSVNPLIIEKNAVALNTGIDKEQGKSTAKVTLFVCLFIFKYLKNCI